MRYDHCDVITYARRFYACGRLVNHTSVTILVSDGLHCESSRDVIRTVTKSKNRYLLVDDVTTVDVNDIDNITGEDVTSLGE